MFWNFHLYNKNNETLIYKNGQKSDSKLQTHSSIELEVFQLEDISH
jgi:hypothetical protein